MTLPLVTTPVYKPAMRAIANITNGFPALVTTETDHNYIDGLIVRLVIFPGYGMQQANQLVGTATTNDAVSFYVDIDTTYFDPYTTPSSTPQTCQVVPVGEINSILDAAVRNVLTN